jgi:hypothetical protein
MTRSFDLPIPEDGQPITIEVPEGYEVEAQIRRLQAGGDIDPGRIRLPGRDPGIDVFPPRDGWGVFIDPDTGEKLYGPLPPHQAATGGPVPGPFV